MASSVLQLQFDMLRAYRHFEVEGFPPGDVHRNVAARALGVPVGTVTPAQRQLAKVTCFGASERMLAKIGRPAAVKRDLPPLRPHERWIARFRAWRARRRARELGISVKRGGQP